MKKILSFVMTVVLALWLGGCGQIVPKADYTFTTEELIDDCFQKHGTSVGESVLTAEKFYCNKRIELIGLVFFSNSKEYKFKEYKFAVLHGRVSDKMAIWFKIVFRNEEDRNKFLEKEYVKLSARFKRLSGGDDSGKYVVIFEFDDGIFLEKL